MANENEALRVVKQILGRQVRMDDDRRRMAEVDEVIALDILKALDSEGFDIVRRRRSDP